MITWTGSLDMLSSTGLFISPSGISELDCATTKTETAERSISIGREYLHFIFVLGALAYFQVRPLGGSREEKWRSQWIRKRSVSWNLPKLSQLWLCNGGFGSFRSAQAATLLEFMYHSRIVLSVGGSVWYIIPKPPLHSHNWLSFAKFQDTERFLIHCERHFSSRLPPSGGNWKYAKAPSTKKNLERFSTYWYAPFCRVCLGCCAVDFGNPEGTYE